MQMLGAFGTLKAHQLDLGRADSSTNRAPEDAGLHSEFLVGFCLLICFFIWLVWGCC